MKIKQQRKLVYLLFLPLLVVVIASSLVTGKYPQYIVYADAALVVLIVLLGVLAVYMVKNTET